ncbi:GroES-like protein [Guyanagaster necrorhizus]|uniref:GroES-like protein n=1 Tax=Guyanagaster necrorhizus TaxID=856835 RepID=A0A9P7VNJ7_9AGAR|nr:GroES-like protein [Guyanagaster necrorhizus MCA 3950]KAG7444478.1 GroES-like protein [Guyanagaster necrorhizus MCA 3950]
MPQQKVLVLQSRQARFTVGTRPIPTAGRGQLLVKVLAAGLNPVDWKIQTYGAFVDNYPAVLGTDIAGEVVDIGEDVTGWSKGDRVVYQGSYFESDGAGFQQYSLIAADFVAKIPEKMSTDEAATICVAFAAACMGLFAEAPIGLGLNPDFSWEPKFTGKTTVIIGGSTSVGQYAIQLLKFVGFSRIITYASARHFDYLATLGITDIIDRGTTPLSQLPLAVKKLTSDPLLVVFDALGFPDAQQAGYDILAEGGQVMTINNDQRPQKSENDGRLFREVLGTVHLPAQSDFGKRMFRSLGKFMDEGVIKPNRLEVLPHGLSGVVAGLDRLKNNQVSAVKLVAHPQDTE